MFVVFSIALIGVEVASKIKTKSLAWLLVIILSGALVYTNRNHRQINMVWPWKENDFWGWTGDAYGEYAAMYRETRDGSSFQFRAEPIMGEGKVDVIKNRSNYLLAETDSKQSMKVRINIMYFPGWEVKVDGLPQTIDTTKSAKSADAPCYVTTRTLPHVDDSGLIACQIPSGKHQIEASYKALPVQKWSNLISLMGIGGYLWILFRSFYPRSTKKMRS